MTHEASSSMLEYELYGGIIQLEKINDGLEFGHGGISRLLIEGAPGNEDLSERMHEAIRHADLLTPISKDGAGEFITDDGCGDGRRVGLVFRDEKLLRTSLYRPKVFGGGLAMAVAGEIALGNHSGVPLSEIVSATADMMEERGVEYGGHTTDLAHADVVASGCGCWDKAVEITAATSRYREAITASIGRLTGSVVELSVIDADNVNGRPNMFDAFGGVNQADNSKYNGTQVISDMMTKGKIVKALASNHRETDIVVNFVPHFTADQGFIRDYTDDRAQAFSVDAWRIVDIAKGLYDDPDTRSRAMAGMLAFTLGVSSVLTAGDQRVWTLKPVAEPEI